MKPVFCQALPRKGCTVRVRTSVHPVRMLHLWTVFCYIQIVENALFAELIE